jgi:hypothetical protein
MKYFELELGRPQYRLSFERSYYSACVTVYLLNFLKRLGGL